MPAQETNWQERPRGRLKVFLGYASGVGKSFRMFDEGRRRRERGQDVVVGALQPKIADTLQPILQSLEVIPMRTVHGVAIMDVPAIVNRNPQVCLFDGLAYHNSGPSGNAHRWQDVEELVAAGITVVGSVNLQHIDDQRESVEKITGKRVTEVIPRAFLNTADEIVIVDAPSSSTSPGLPVLRKMALLLFADVIDSGLQNYLRPHGIKGGWGTQERLLLCLTPEANVDRMLASARRNAARFHCQVLAVYVDHPRLAGSDRSSLEKKLAQANAAGARVEVLKGEDPEETVARYAATHEVTQIFVGHGRKVGWLTRLFGSPVSKLVRAGRGMDVRVFPN